MRRILPIALTLAFAAAPAHAAEYRVYGCDAPDARARGILPFSDFEVPLNSMDHDDHCLGADGVATFQWPPGMAVLGGTRGGWKLDAPAGASLTKLGWRGSAIGIAGTGTRVELATGDDGATFWDSAGDLPTDQRRFVLPAGASTIILRQTCRLAVC